jgi:hypothetical protein
MGLECLRDCNAACCRAINTIRFDFSADEAQMIRDADGELYYLEDGYVMVKPCPFLQDMMCDLHRDERQPQCCRDNKAGGRLCQAVREGLEK